MKARLIVRNLKRNKLFAILNIIGLGIALSCVTLIASWVYHESNYDRFHNNFEQIYQLNFKYSNGDIMVGSPNPLAPLLPDNVAAIKKSARIRSAPDFAFSYNDKMFYEENGITADPSIFDIFTFKTIAGNPKAALDRVDGMVVTRSFAMRYFGSEDALNKEIKIEGNEVLPILAILEDLPEQSHIQFDYILPHKMAEEYQFCGLNWGDPNFRTYILLTTNGSSHDAENGITRVASDNGMPHVKYDGATASLRPMKDIYLDYTLDNRLGKTGDYRNLYIFSSIAVLILVLACINYINLSISMFSKRQTNSAIRNICGANKKIIFKDHFIENSITVLLSFIVSLLLISIFVPSFESFLNISIREAFFDKKFLLIVFGILCAAILVCTIYPSMLFSRNRAVKFIRLGKWERRGEFAGMVVVQNIIAAALIIVALGVNSQMKFIQNKKLGFDIDKVACTYLRGNIYKETGILKKAILDNPEISDVCLKDCLPYTQRNMTTGIGWLKDGTWQNDNEGKQVVMETTRIDDRYFEMMDVDIIAGRNFSSSIPGDKHNYIVNESAVRAMQLKQPVGADFHLYGEKGKIIGVIKDTYFKSLHGKINPQLFHLYEDESTQSYFSALLFKITGNTKEALKKVENIWKENNPGIPFDYHFLDQDYELLYEKEKNLSVMINIFSFLSIFIACLGLFGQSVISSENRTKEIGVRKVNGAKIHEVILMLNKISVLRILIALIFSVPVSYFALQKWLSNFVYKTDIKIGLFILAGIMVLIISLLTISLQSWCTARKNPVEALRYE